MQLAAAAAARALGELRQGANTHGHPGGGRVGRASTSEPRDMFEPEIDNDTYIYMITTMIFDDDEAPFQLRFSYVLVMLYLRFTYILI